MSINFRMLEYKGKDIMKSSLIAILVTACLPMAMLAQTDDDMYFVPKKKSKAQSVKTASRAPSRTVRAVHVNSTEDASADTTADYHVGDLRDVDEYNRRGSSSESVTARMSGDTLYVTSSDGKVTAYTGDGGETEVQTQDNDNYYGDNYYDDDFHYSARLHRYHGYYYRDPFFWDYTYGWYDPWYDPWYGWYAPYYRYGYISWYSWGWGWHCHPGWDMAWGHHGCYRDHMHHHGFAYNHGLPHRTLSNPAMNGVARGNRVGSSSVAFRGGGITSTAQRSSVRGTDAASSARTFRGAGVTSGSSRGNAGVMPSRGSSSGTSRGGNVATTPSRRNSSGSSRGTMSSTPSRGSSSGSSRGGSVSSGSFGGSSRGGGSFGGSSRGGGSFGGSHGGGRGR